MFEVKVEAEEMEATVDQIHQKFALCEECVLIANQLVSRKWLPSFLRPDLTPMERILTTVKNTYEEFQKTRLKRLDAKY